MYKSLKNFAYVGRSYFIGDTVPDNVAAAMGTDYASKPVKETKSHKYSETKFSRKGE